MQFAKYLHVPFALIVAGLLAACGGGDTPPPGESLAFSGDRVGFAVGFYTFSGNLIASQKIYMRVLDGKNRTVYGTDVMTDDKGVAHFENVPAGNFTVEFKYGQFGTCNLDIDLESYKGAKSGELAGDCTF